jgi:hypothetical protein
MATGDAPVAKLISCGMFVCAEKTLLAGKFHSYKSLITALLDHNTRPHIFLPFVFAENMFEVTARYRNVAFHTILLEFQTTFLDQMMPLPILDMLPLPKIEEHSKLISNLPT